MTKDLVLNFPNKRLKDEILHFVQDDRREVSEEPSSF